MGIERLLLSLQEHGALEPEEPYPALPLLVLREEKGARPEDLLLRDRVRLRYPGHRVELQVYRHGKVGEQLHRLAQVASSQQTHSSVLIQGDDERAAGTLIKKDLQRRTSEVVRLG